MSLAAAFPLGWGALLGVLALTSFGNGVWMLLQPEHWYHELPAGVPDFGPLNVHFVRDVGCAFLAMGVALGWAAQRPELRRALVSVVAVFYVGHALVHLHDNARGLVDAHHWWLDAPGVWLPAALLVWATWRLHRHEKGAER